ncbi:Meiotic Sister-Chromatid recombination aldehyde dehydrogenase [Coniosporium apollinis]|uniref:aldehyde dehydrogenase (NAD(+)) n=1 Tax=Coniosporium apollinis TaxID=61459 RepID=A0ABQ9NPP4_9PEZI|nr:Meiotic Sister-Chromatid recombination aldehyde dehydrogenase [Coniosporium apollinis]
MHFEHVNNYYSKPTMDAFEALQGTPVAIAITAIAVILILYAAWAPHSTEEAVPFTVPVPEQCLPDSTGEVLEKPSLKVSGSSLIQCYAPATGKSLGVVNPATQDGVDRAIAQATEAQKAWAKTTFSQRRRLLRTLLKFILDNQETISTAACLDSGKTRVDSSFGEILVTAEKLKWTIDHGEKALKPEKRPTNLLMIYKKNEVRWEPLGVVAACVSWNYPFHNLLSPAISALFTGNAIILKPSESTAWSSLYFTSILHAALTACGHSPHLVRTLTCWPPVAEHLTSHPGIAHLTFIGSRPVAHKVVAAAARSLTPCTVELGGKDAAIILDDVRDLKKVASILLRGVFQSAGQNCIGIERVIALPGIYDRLITHLTPLIQALRPGSVLDSEASDQEVPDVGAAISPANFAHLESLIDQAVAQGARLLAGGSRFTHPRWPQGHYFAPTLLVDVTPQMRIAQAELFAPIFVLMRAETVDAAIAIANSTPYALGSSVFGSSRQDLDKVVAEVKAGMVSVNDFGVYYMVSLPFGGVKGSGYGRFGGEEGLRSLCNTKAVCRDRWPGWVETGIPGPLDYPIRNGREAWRMCRGIVEVGYGENLGRRVAGIKKLMGFGV